MSPVILPEIKGHWMRSALVHVPKGQQTMVAAALR